MMVDNASSFEPKFGAKPPSSPTAVFKPFAFKTFFKLWKISAPIRRASLKFAAPTGCTINSWISMLLSACSPPLMIFIIGTGIEYWPGVPLRLAICSYKGIPVAIASALATAKETARIAFAPNTSLFSVPSKSIITWSMLAWSAASKPINAGVILSLIAATAFNTPLPK